MLLRHRQRDCSRLKDYYGTDARPNNRGYGCCSTQRLLIELPELCSTRESSRARSLHALPGHMCAEFFFFLEKMKKRPQLLVRMTRQLSTCSARQLRNDDVNLHSVPMLRKLSSCVDFIFIIIYRVSTESHYIGLVNNDD